MSSISEKRERVWRYWSEYQARRYNVRKSKAYLSFHTPCYECGRHVHKYANSFHQPRNPENKHLNHQGKRFWDCSHVAPDWLGGSGDVLNMRITCEECNRCEYKKLLPCHRSRLNGYHHSLACQENICFVPSTLTSVYSAEYQKHI